MLQKEYFTNPPGLWKRLRKNKRVLLSIYILAFLAIAALLAPLIANEKPLYVSYKGNSLFPAFSFKKNIIISDKSSSSRDQTAETLQYDNTDWKKIKCDKIIFPPIVYSPAKPDYANADYAAPGSEQYFSGTHGEPVPLPKRFSHWLGTDKLGRDVLSGLIHGARISLTIGIFSMAIAAFIGILLGAIAGFFGDHELKTSRGIFWALILGCITGWFYALDLRSFVLKDSMQQSAAAFLFQLAVSIVILVFNLALFYFLGKIISKISFFKKQVFIKADSIVSRLIEILISLPRLILIISVAAIARPSLINLIIIIGLTSWTEIARLTRAEFLRLRHLEFIEAARALGYGRTRILFRHALPNGIAPALVAIAFGVASAILAESSLSFLGIGVPQDVVTWGSLLAQGKENYNAWWLVIFPGLAIFITVTVYNLIGDGLRDAMDPKLK